MTCRIRQVRLGEYKLGFPVDDLGGSFIYAGLGLSSSGSDRASRFLLNLLIVAILSSNYFLTARVDLINKKVKLIWKGVVMKAIALTGVILFGLLLLAGCAPGPNTVEKTPNQQGKIAGFWKGLWHGFISPVTFIISLFTSNIRIYEVHNNGSWYNFGFVLGAGLFLQGGILGSRRARRK